MLKRLVCLWALAAGGPIFAGTLIITGEVASGKGVPTAAATKDVTVQDPLPAVGIVSRPAGVVAQPVAVITPVKPAMVWTLETGRFVGQELKAWGEKANWKVIWSMTKDWTVPASTSFSGEFSEAAADVIKTLAANGAMVHAQFYEGNKTMVVTGPGVPAQ